MAVFQVVVLFIFILGLARLFGVRFVEAVPAAVSIQVLLLYGLCFFNGLWLWDYISAAITAGAVVLILRQQKQRKKELLSFAKKELLDAGTVTAVALSVIVTFGVLAKPVSWWDDYNFWAADVKSIFYLDGKVSQSPSGTDLFPQNPEHLLFVSTPSVGVWVCLYLLCV